ncbi:hypothetical protein GALMADRAFT_844524 [Galerina marginata CBS 339.88]|uniref:PH domain-containing protein n=1 Tax=Galerina marginata (strain CBS 339.88) TaxID=685588 RepID=A0A067THL8_GALM3|nr:hypothetical protein GALMADRAFT_844524 [Galerina marginata CBS 339.88]
MASSSLNRGGPSTSNVNLPAESLNQTTQPASHVRRMFVGPMPEKVIARNESQGKKPKLTLGSVLSLGTGAYNVGDDTSDKSEEVERVLKEHALRFFLHHGGKAEDWGDEEEQNVVDDLKNRWKESEWGKLWDRRHHRRKNDPQTTGNWFGTSFEVGSLLGMNMMNGQEHNQDKAAPSTQKPESSKVPVDDNDASNSLAPTGPETFVTPRSSFNVSRSEQVDLNSGQPTEPSLENQGTIDIPSSTASSRIGLLRSNSVGDVAQPSDTAKGKARMVHYADSANGASAPLAPEAVLDRTASTVDQNTSLAATVPDEPSKDLDGEFQWGDVVLRDRMLVRVSSTKSESLPQFNDAVNRTTRDLHFENWGEFLVAWRRDNIEIYRDHGAPYKEWAVGHKQLSYVIPLRASRTRLSLYSFVDLTFCITCAPTTTRLNASASRWVFSGEKEGTNIFVFKLKSRSRAYDWCWQLWRQMGGQIPRTIDVYNPRLSTKVTIEVSEEDQLNSAALYQLFKRENILNLCMETLRKVPHYKYLVVGEIEKGKSLQLAWRLDATLDWMWLETDVSGKHRDWSVLCGLAFKQASRPPVLEIRLAGHTPTHIHLKDGKRLNEPPSMEGYLDRIKPNTQTKQQIYLSTHNGYLFTLNTLSAFPPMPPGLTPIPTAYMEPQTLRQAEIRRGTNQIMSATGVCDLRTIIAVRRASHPSSAHMHDQKESTNEETSWFSVWENSDDRNAEDEVDDGGDAGLTKHGDRTRLRIRRSFELLLNTGHIVRFEAYSSGVALEWIERLRALIFYWKNRHRNDAKEEIELAQAQRPRLTPLTRVFQDEECAPEAPADPAAPYPALDTLYNWCVLDGCRPIIRGGRLYMKKGLHGQYQLVQLFLVAGHLVLFRVGPHSSLYPAIRKKINLLNAYVCSGYFAAQTLPKGQYMPNTPPPPRRYQDGLETDDREEDMLFMIWYRPQRQMTNADEDPTTTSVNMKSVPSLSAKNKTLVFRTRSLLEKDSWCWALNSEIEKIVRAQKSREEKLRETGNLVKLR